MEIVFDYRREEGSSREQREQERVEQLAACYQSYLGHELPNQLVPIQAFARMLLEHHAAALDAEGRLLLDRLAALTQRTDTLALRDTGRGMTEGQVALFEPFAAGRFPGAAGPGLGLFLVCQATARWGGLLRVRSEPGQGSVFSLFLPDPGTARQAPTS